MAAINNNKGFTIVELLIVMGMSLIVMGGIYQVYYSQQKAYVLQDQTSAMQQNLRAAIYLMTRNIRMAGYSTAGATAGLTAAAPNSIAFTMDLNGNGTTTDPNENVTYRLYDAYGDGDNDLSMDSGSGNSPLAENMDVLNFVYLDGNGTILDDDGNGNVIASIPSIRSIQVTLLARVNKPDMNYNNNRVYINQQNQQIYTANDNYRRRLLTREIQCRNLGL